MRYTSKKSLSSLFLGGAASLAMLIPAGTANAGTDTYLGEVMAFGGNFCPRGYANADGGLLPISQYSALFSLYGTTYGGDGRTTFGLPDLRGRAAINDGQSPGLQDYRLGAKGGVETVTIPAAAMPAHTHSMGSHLHSIAGHTHGGNMVASATGPNTGNPAGAAIATYNARFPAYNSGDPVDTPMASGSIVTDSGGTVRTDSALGTRTGNAGGGQALNIRSPYQVINYCIATIGIFPSRN